MRVTKQVKFKQQEIVSTEIPRDIFVQIVEECSLFSNSIFNEIDCEYSTNSEHTKLKENSQETTLYEDDTTLEKSMDYTIETVTSDYSDLSIGNAFNESDIEIYNVPENIVQNIPVPKMTKGRMGTPATICTVNTINTLRS